MSRETYVRRNGKLVLKQDAEPLQSGPYIQSDYLPDLRHPSTGQIMDSKSRFRAETKARGLVEVGNEPMRDTRRMTNFGTAERKTDIARAIRQLGG